MLLFVYRTKKIGWEGDRLAEKEKEGETDWQTDRQYHGFTERKNKKREGESVRGEKERGGREGDRRRKREREKDQRPMNGTDGIQPKPYLAKRS